MADSLDYAEELLRFTDWLAAHGPRGITESAYEYWLMRAVWMERAGCAAEDKRLTGPIMVASAQLAIAKATTTALTACPRWLRLLVWVGHAKLPGMGRVLTLGEAWHGG